MELSLLPEFIAKYLSSLLSCCLELLIKKSLLFQKKEAYLTLNRPEL